MYLVIYALNGFFLPEQLLSELCSPLLTLLQLIVLFWVAANLFKAEKITRHALLAYSVASAIVALGMLLHLPGFSDSMLAAGVERATALGYNPNTLACSVDASRPSSDRFVPKHGLQPLYTAVVRYADRAHAGGHGQYQLPGRDRRVDDRLWSVLTPLLAIKGAVDCYYPGGSWFSCYYISCDAGSRC